MLALAISNCFTDDTKQKDSIIFFKPPRHSFTRQKIPITKPLFISKKFQLFSGEAVYITPVFDPKKHPPVATVLYDAPIKTVKTDYSVYDLPYAVNLV